MVNSDNIKTIINNSASLAKKLGVKVIETEHLLYGVLCVNNSFSQKLLLEVGVNKDVYKKIILSYLKNVVVDTEYKLVYSKSVSTIFAQVESYLRQNKQNYKENEYILHLILSNKNFKATKILSNVFKIDINILIKKLEKYLGLNEEKFEEKAIKLQQNYCKELPDELLNLGYDLTKKISTKPLQKIIGRDKEISRVVEILCRKTKNNPVLIGEPGVGKSSVVEGLAQKIIENDIPELLSNNIIFALDIASLMAGTKFRGSMEQKLKDVISVIQKYDNIIVFIDEIHMLAEAGAKEGEVSPADILKPLLARGELRCIGATTLDEYRKYIEKDPALERRFQPVNIDEPTIEDTIDILKGIASSFEDYHSIKISNEAIIAAVNLSARYITNRFLPDKAIDLIDEACSKLKIGNYVLPPEIKEINAKIRELENQKNEYRKMQNFLKANEINYQIADFSKKFLELKNNMESLSCNIKEVSAENIREVVASWTGIPVNKLSANDAEKLMNLENLLSEKVIGQEEAVKVVANAIRRSRADINDPNKPIGSLLFLGPTGVGKTELTKAIADVLFDSEDSIIRFDMSEFMESHSISRLIGAPPGYVGHDDGGELTEAVKRKPYSIVLFDEIEKAHPDIFNLMLQIFDEGHLTDSKGNKINFKNTLIILTSNNGVQDLIARRKFEKQNPNEITVSTEEFLTNKLRDKFKPELLNRIDNVVIFDTLSKDSILKIGRLMLNSLVKNLERNKKITLQFSESAISLLCDLGYDEAYGARPLKRVIDKEIRDKLATMIVSGKLKNNSAILVDVINNEFIFKNLC